MTKITFFKNKDLLIGFEVSGHTGYAEIGSDIVCSAVSSITQMTVLGLRSIKLNVKKDNKKGYLFCKLSKNISENEILESQNWFETLKISLEDLEKDYKKYLSLEVKDEIY